MILVMMWAISFLTKKKEPAPATETPVEPQAQVEPIAAETLSAIAESLPEEIKQDAQKTVPSEFVTLGSLDPESPYRMLVTLSSRGAAVTRVEMNEAGFRDCADNSGYLGQIIADETAAGE